MQGSPWCFTRLDNQGPEYGNHFWGAVGELTQWRDDVRPRSSVNATETYACHTEAPSEIQLLTQRGQVTLILQNSLDTL